MNENTTAKTDYKIAHDKATLALDTSDLNTETETTGKKRKRKEVQRFKILNENDEPNVDFCPNKLSLHGTSSSTRNTCAPNVECKIFPPSNEKSIPFSIFNKSSVSLNSSLDNDTSSYFQNGQILSPNNRTEKLVVMENRQKSNEKILKTILMRLESCTNESSIEDLPVTLPVQNWQDLIILDEMSSSVGLSRLLGVIGGSNLKSITYNIMNQLVCHELALKMNWSDKYKNKHAFGKLKKIPGIVYIAVQKHEKGGSNADVEKCIKRWLMQAPDRNGGRAQRALKTLTQNS
ncbi:uncharacterized protein LOC124817568 isoform X2 [Hydra vulgaris]|uniref:uncharacterized protein LOC124817568 isoform X2 n=1 Tax=Hydra vulgaris TaxID=6087 RepID=UPI001F5FC03F|nr:uncharacterized protein LOC124817568 [Hydra vulgaris]